MSLFDIRFSFFRDDFIVVGVVVAMSNWLVRSLLEMVFENV